MVCRLYTASLRQGERFYLRQLLLHYPARSHEDLRKHEGTVYSTFKESCYAKGLVIPDNEPQLVFQEAIGSLATPYQLRTLYVVLASDGADLLELFNNFSFQMGMDFHLRGGGCDSSGELSVVARNSLLKELWNKLRQVGVDPAAHGLPVPIDDSNELQRERLALL